MSLVSLLTSARICFLALLAALIVSLHFGATGAWADNDATQDAGKLHQVRLNTVSRVMRGPFDYEEPVGRFPHYEFRHRLLNRSYHAFSGAPSGIDQPRPTVLLLHGSGRTGLSMVDMWRRVASTHGLVVIAPNSARSGGWMLLLDSPGFFDAVLRHAEQNYPIDRERLFVFGHSAGAVYATQLAQDNALNARAVAAHAGYPERIARRPDEAGPPVGFFLGQYDHLFPPSDLPAIGQAMAANGHDVTLAFLPNHSHWYYADGPAINAEVWRFFKRYGRSQRQ
ncbi:MAG: dienelactone hydrolase family protein [Pseudomonadota bacterium]